MEDDKAQPASRQREQFLTARQLAAILQVSESTVRRLVREGRIPFVRITPRNTRFHLQSVREALDGDHDKPRTRRSTKEARTDDSQLSFTELLKEEDRG